MRRYYYIPSCFSVVFGVLYYYRLCLLGIARKQQGFEDFALFEHFLNGLVLHLNLSTTGVSWPGYC
jgi:hypothetical protein